ncbi:MAG: glucose 1-dehydrogenase [Verrucomicrobiaceae bacterium]|nr:MAG: glucose 1-dehydrogenase [Verrucomicrobiaceae bacterium]
MTPPTFDLTGKTAIVTGASRGLGKGFALTLARAGCDLAITARSVEDLAGTVAEIEALGRRVLPVALDVRDYDSIRAAGAQIVEHFGNIDILVNNAGCNRRKPALEVSWDDWNTVLDTNLRGTFFVSQAIAPSMIAAGKGRIINIGSVTCVAGYAGLAPYGASRGGVKQLTMSLASDWGPHGITVNCLAPGWFKTAQNAVLYENHDWVDYLCERIPLGRPGQPGDLDGTLLFLASDASVYVTGQTILVDGGISVGQVRALPAPPK